ncbi:MAG: hypothetical protein GOV01_00430 [Candidatus Altiarchaeota archaeon]|nr:hypothetical protein [Candidatus Altiarchaeota archaeon]
MDGLSMDLPERSEQRFILPIGSYEPFVESVESFMEKKIFSDADIVQTIYMNTDEHLSPFGTSLKVRKYLPKQTDIPIVEGEQLLEIKRTDSGNKASKSRTKVDGIDDAEKLLNSTKCDYGPYLAVQYQRKHYVPTDGQGLRVTIDKDVNYFFLNSYGEWIKIGNEDDFFRIEVKRNKQDNEIAQMVEDILMTEGAVSTISKKYMSYNLLRRHRTGSITKPLYKDLSGIEIEAKLDVTGDVNDVFSEIRQMFKTKILDFYISRGSPHIMESGSINTYYHENGSDMVLKAVMKCDGARVVEKGYLEVVRDLYDFGCVTKRTETKKDFINVWDFHPDEVIGKLFRGRKTRYLENSETGRIYQLSLDHCCDLNGDEVMHQLEVEYVGTVKSGESSESDVIADISNIVQILIQKNLPIVPSTRTKESWLRRNIRYRER